MTTAPKFNINTQIEKASRGKNYFYAEPGLSVFAKYHFANGR
jgi:hypothetical protein